jgi:hypothetical protein
MSEPAASFLVSDEMTLTAEQVQSLAPFFARRQEGSWFLVASLYPSGGDGWRMRVSAIPATRKGATLAAIKGETKPAKAKRAKPTATTMEVEAA